MREGGTRSEGGREALGVREGGTESERGRH